jgi:hypothetical protein
MLIMNETAQAAQRARQAETLLLPKGNLLTAAAWLMNAGITMPDCLHLR